METALTKLVGCRYPIIAGPMFLVSDETLTAAVCKTGATAAIPSLNWRNPDLFRAAVQKIRKLAGDAPFGVNLIVNKVNPRLEEDLKICVEEKVPFIITSLGNPKIVIEKMHAIGSKVFCDVTTLEYAKKVEALGADAVIAVSSGAGGHAGSISPIVLIPYLKRNISIPIIAAGGISCGEQMAAALILGAEGVQLGTRFIASQEAQVSTEYKKAILNAAPEDIIMTTKISGTPAAVIKTPQLEKALEKSSWKDVWSAGQSAGLINEVMPVSEIVEGLIRDCKEAFYR
jgi:nitronate monooxygenase